MVAKPSKSSKRNSPRNTIQVKTNIIKSNGKKVAINYLLREKDTEWSVIDIFLSGKYSELAKQRSEYTSVLKRKGFIGLVDTVEEKVKRMAQKETSLGCPSHGDRCDHRQKYDDVCGDNRHPDDSHYCRGLSVFSTLEYVGR